MNKAYKEQLAIMLDNINNINSDQLNTLGLEYLKCKRIGKFMLIFTVFESIFLAKLYQIHSSLSKIQFPNKIFKCYVILVLDIERNRFHAHRLFTFPINLEYYDADHSNIYNHIYDQMKEHPLHFTSNQRYKFSSMKFNARRPLSTRMSHTFGIEGSYPVEFNFNIDTFIDKHVNIVNDRVTITDPYYSRDRMEKDKLLENPIFDCSCVEDKSELRYACQSCGDKKQDDCKEHHTKKCQCGKFTYHRREMCLRCHVIYTKSKRVLQRFDKTSYDLHLRVGRSLVAYIPYLHYNQGSSGICLGNGAEVIDRLLSQSLNPIRLMLSYKANLAYTDQNGTLQYYHNYRDKFTSEMFDKHIEFLLHINQVFGSSKEMSEHVLSLYCYCPQCFFMKIVLFQYDRKLHDCVFESSKAFIVSRDKFIKLYKRHMKQQRSNTYTDSYLHGIIKVVVNTPPRDFLIIE